MTGDDVMLLLSEVKRVADAIDRLTEVMAIQTSSNLQERRPGAVVVQNRLNSIIKTCGGSDAGPA